jgi:Vam6/Vps39-like protein vacuolar protein sorting-associated protein 39
MRDKLQPSISYLQRLGPEYLEQIFKSSRWVFEQDRDIAFEVCYLPFSSIP